MLQNLCLSVQITNFSIPKITDKCHNTYDRAMKTFHHIVYAGLSPHSNDLHEKRSIVLVNCISLILLSVLILLLSYRVIVLDNVTWDVFLHTFLKGFFVFSIPIALNGLRLFNMAKFLVCLIPLAFIWQVYIQGMRDMQHVETSMYDGMRLYLLILSPFPYLIFKRESMWSLVISSVPLLGSLVFFEQILGWAGVNHQQKGLGGEDYPLMYIRTLLAYLAISAVCLVFQTMVSQYEESIRRMVAELKCQKEEIIAQNEALVSSQDQLNAIHQNLEFLVDQKTEAIQRQNETILKFTFANSHMVRASVARMQGLINLSRIDDAMNRPIYLEKVEEEVDLLDRVTRTITKELNAALE